MAKYSILKSIVCVSLLSACGHMPGSHDIKPKQEPVYNFTQSSKVLSCLGNKIDRTSDKPIDVYVSNIPDHTIPSIESGFLTKNAVMMVTTALDRLDTDKVAVIGKNGAMRDRRQVQILGSFTELNRTVQSSALSSEAVFPGGIELEFGTDKNTNHIALDLAMSEYNRIIPKTATSVSIQIRGNSGDATLTYDEGDDFAAIGAIGFTGQEGFHSGQRLLIETSVALMMSKYFNVDIRSCLQSNKREKQSPIDTEYDEPVFPNEENNEVKPQPVATNTELKRTRPELTQEQKQIKQQPIYVAPKAPAEPFYEETAPTLQKQSGVYVMPKGSPNRFIRTQPPEYNSAPSQDGYSGVPAKNIPDPATGSKDDFINEQIEGTSNDEPESPNYNVVF